MKKLILLTSIIFAFLLFGACNSATEPAKSETIPEKPKVESEPKSDSKPDEPAKKEDKDSDTTEATIKPDELDPNKPLPVGDVTNAIVADAEAWEGKEVIVRGDFDSVSESTLKDGKKITGYRVKNAEGRAVMTCNDSEPPVEDILRKGKDRVFKGKVSSVNTQYKDFILEPCAIQKQ